MPISRRVFIKVGTLAAIAAGISIKPGLLAMAQEPLVKLPASDPLSNYTQATFAQYLNSIFTLRGNKRVELTLTKVEDTLPEKASRTGGRESFTLSFRGGGVAFPQDTYVIEHAALGTFSLFLVPAGSDENGTHGYVAVINRLAHSATIPAPRAGRKPRSRKPATTTTPSTSKPGESPEKPL